jgi:hypothetical protein
VTFGEPQNGVLAMNQNTALTERLWRGTMTLFFLVSLSACAALEPDNFPTRDVGGLTAVCGQVSFIVSVNSDDDNDNSTEDRRDRRPSADENNLREIEFPVISNADQVFVTEPVLVVNNTPVAGVRLRGWKSDNTPFQFNAAHNVPIKLFLEGIEASTSINDIGFEYQYKKNPDQWLCGGAAKGTVVAVAAGLDVSSDGAATDTQPDGSTKNMTGSGTSFKKYRKMLITGTGRATGSVSPDLTHEWLHSRGTFADKDALQTDFTAGTTPTPAASIDAEPMLLQVSSGSQKIDAHFPVNITAPLHLHTTKRDMDVVLPCRNANNRRCRFDANQGTFTPVPTYRVKYTIQDQQRKSIKHSAYAGVLPQIRENIGTVMTSPIPNVNNWITNSLSWTMNWKSKPGGKFTDKIEAYSADKSLVVVNPPANPNRRIFHGELRNAANSGVLMHVPPPLHHIWFLGVNGHQSAEGTQNDFSSVVHNRQPAGGDIQIQLRTRYTITTP